MFLNADSEYNELSLMKTNKPMRIIGFGYKKDRTYWGETTASGRIIPP